MEQYLGGNKSEWTKPKTECVTRVEKNHFRLMEILLNHSWVEKSWTHFGRYSRNLWCKLTITQTHDALIINLKTIHNGLFWYWWKRKRLTVFSCHTLGFERTRMYLKEIEEQKVNWASTKLTSSEYNPPLSNRKLYQSIQAMLFSAMELNMFLWIEFLMKLTLNSLKRVEKRL